MPAAKVLAMEWAVAEDGDAATNHQTNAICVYAPVVNAISMMSSLGDL